MPGKDSLPSEDLDALIVIGRNTLKKLFACCLLLSKDEITRVTAAEATDRLVDEEDCENVQLFDDDETDFCSELQSLLHCPLEVVFYREIILEAVES